MKPLAVAVLVLALFSVSAQPRTQSCGMKMASVVATKCECCASMKSCVLPQVPAQPTATSPVAQQTIVLFAAPLHEITATDLPEPFRYPELLTLEQASHSRPQLALLCTFLI